MNNAQSGRGAAAQQREQAIGDYLTACNAGDAEAVAATCTPDAVHYFPVRMYGDDEPVRGGLATGKKLARPVRSPGSRWSIDGPILCDPGHHQAAIEFTAEQKKSATIIRGSKWYRFDPGTGLITEIRAYLASPPAQGLQRLELGGFPYAERGYAASTGHTWVWLRPQYRMVRCAGGGEARPCRASAADGNRR